MANTFDASLVLDTMSERIITILGPLLAPLGSFSKDFTTDELFQEQSVKVKKFTEGGATQKNPTNFTGGGTKAVPVSVKVDHYSHPFNITSKEYNQGHRLEHAIDIELRTFANTILDVAFAPLTEANFTAMAIANQAVTSDHLKTLWGQIANSPVKNAILDGPAFAKFLPSDKNSFTPGAGAYGYDAFHLCTRWTGAEANTYGFVGGPDAIAVAAGIPQQVPNLAQIVQSKLVDIPGLGLTVQLNLWASADTRALNASFDVMFGASVADGTAGRLIKTALKP